MDDFCVMFWIVIIIVVAVFIFTSIQANIQDKADRAENKARSEDYIYKRKENPNVIGGTNLDRFFIECVLSGCNNFSSKKNISKAELLLEVKLDKFLVTMSYFFICILHTPDTSCQGSFGMTVYQCSVVKVHLMPFFHKNLLKIHKGI